MTFYPSLLLPRPAFLPDPNDGSLYILGGKNKEGLMVSRAVGLGASCEPPGVPWAGEVTLPLPLPCSVLQKLPFTIPELVQSSPCRSSDGVLYTGTGGSWRTWGAQWSFWGWAGLWGLIKKPFSFFFQGRSRTRGSLWTPSQGRSRPPSPQRPGMVCAHPAPCSTSDGPVSQSRAPIDHLVPGMGRWR